MNKPYNLFTALIIVMLSKFRQTALQSGVSQEEFAEFGGQLVDKAVAALEASGGTLALANVSGLDPFATKNMVNRVKIHAHQWVKTGSKNCLIEFADGISELISISQEMLDGIIDADFEELEDPNTLSIKIMEKLNLLPESLDMEKQKSLSIELISIIKDFKGRFVPVIKDEIIIEMVKSSLIGKDLTGFDTWLDDYLNTDGRSRYVPKETEWGDQLIAYVRTHVPASLN